MKKNILSFTVFVLLSLFAFGGARTASALTLTPVKFEISGDPGQVVEQEMTLINERDTQETYYVSFSNFEAQGETGSPSFVDPTEGLGTWMHTDMSVTLAPGTSKIVPLTISIPDNAEPGGYFAAVFWGTNPPATDSGSIAIGAKTGILVLLRVNGPIDEEGGILEFGTRDHQKFFTSLPVGMYYRFQNSGSDRIKPKGDVSIRHFLGFIKAKVPANTVEGNVLPGQTRRFEVAWQSKNGGVEEEKTGFFAAVGREWRNFAFGYYRAELKLTYGAEDTETSSAKTGIWVFPWQLLLTLTVLVVIVRMLVRKISKHHRAHMMKEMREEIKREMQEEKKDTTGGAPRAM